MEPFGNRGAIIAEQYPTKIISIQKHNPSEPEAFLHPIINETLLSLPLTVRHSSVHWHPQYNTIEHRSIFDTKQKHNKGKGGIRALEIKNHIRREDAQWLWSGESRINKFQWDKTVGGGRLFGTKFRRSQPNYFVEVLRFSNIAGQRFSTIWHTFRLI